jgi:uncharacterized membrane protein YfcA
MEILGYASAVAIGLILGLLGGGGSILAIPVLVYLFDIEPVRASAYSLFVVGITSLVGVGPKYKEGLVNFRAALLFGVPSVLSIFSTRKWFVPFIPDPVVSFGELELSKRLLLLGLFAVLMILAALPMIRKQSESDAPPSPKPVYQLVLQGIGVGFITGLVGAGGGFLIIPALVFLGGLKFKTAAGTSLLIIGLNSLMGFLGDVLNYPMDWPFLLYLTGLSILGIFIGARLSNLISGSALKRTFGWFILATGIYILLKEAI